MIGNVADNSSVSSALMWCHTVCKAPLFLKSALFFTFELLIRLGNCSIFCSAYFATCALFAENLFIKMTSCLVKEAPFNDGFPLSADGHIPNIWEWVFLSRILACRLAPVRLSCLWEHAAWLQIVQSESVNLEGTTPWQACLVHISLNP
eukprot:s1007_g8.t1